METAWLCLDRVTGQWHCKVWRWITYGVGLYDNPRSGLYVQDRWEDGYWALHHHSSRWLALNCRVLWVGQGEAHLSARQWPQAHLFKGKTMVQEYQYQCPQVACTVTWPQSHLWEHPKKQLNGYETPPGGMHELWERVQVEWENIPREVCVHLIESMPRKVQTWQW